MIGAAPDSSGPLPLPRWASHPLVFAVLAVVHVYLGSGHLIELLRGDLGWTHVWKGGGAMLGAYWFAALAAARLARRAPRVRIPA